MLNQRQRAVLAEKLMDGANIAAGTLVFGPFLTATESSQISPWPTFAGILIWNLLSGFGIILLRDPQNEHHART